MATDNRNFHLFNQLPTELRLEIWQFYLPHRVYEIEIPRLELFSAKPKPSSITHLYHTAYSYSRPPLIARVCRESRGVAFETGNVAGSLATYTSN